MTGFLTRYDDVGLATSRDELTPADVCRLAPAASRDVLDRLLHVRAFSMGRTATLMVEAIAAAFDSDVKGAIALLRRAQTQASRAECPYVIDVLAPYYCSVGDFDRLCALRCADCRDLPADVRAPLLAMHAVMSALEGDREGSSGLAAQAIAFSTEHDGPIVRGRVLIRCAFASYHFRQYERATQYALESAALYESAGAHLGAATSYSVAAAIAQCYANDGRLAASLFDRMLRHADASGSRSMRRAALAGSRYVAAQRLDVQAFSATAARLQREPAANQLQESLVLLLSDVLGYGWRGEFASAEALLISYSTRTSVLPEHQALLCSLRAVVALAHDRPDDVRELSREAARQTANASPTSAIHDYALAQTARAVAAFAAYSIGDKLRAQRMLSRRFDRDGRLRRLLTSTSVEVDACPELFKGYAHFINVALNRASARRTAHGLTPAEVDVMRAAAHGDTVRELAEQLDKSRHTVARQLESIYAKLSVRNRTQAIHRARELGLLQ